MVIVADENMPLVEETFGAFGEIRKLPGRQISNKDLLDAKMLLVRSVTRVDAQLLENTPVEFVGTATIGTDHFDQKWMTSKGIFHVSAPGCNADSVAEYVVSCLAWLSIQKKWKQAESQVGIVGAGNVGQRVANRMNILGIPHLQYDPPREMRDPLFSSCSLFDLLKCKVICLHAPIIKDGQHPSFHMIGEDFLSQLPDETILISAGRGPVVDFEALQKHQDRLICCLDVWEPEPEIHLSSLNAAIIATPHVAGYSLQSKWRGTTMVHEAYCRWKNISPTHCPWPIEPPTLEVKGQSWQDVVLELYNPAIDTQRTKTALRGTNTVGATFDQLRKTYPLRHEFNFPKFIAPNLMPQDRQILKRLGLRFIEHV